MKGKTVFVLTINEVSEFEQFDHDPVAYESREEARALLAEAKAEAINDYIDEEDPAYVINNDTPDYFSLYNEQEGWSHTHYEVSVTECIIQ